MCSDPIQLDADLTVACRKCNDCIATKKNHWVARACAEAASAGATTAIRLSYRNLPDGSKPAGARVFEYRDVQLFMKALREAYFRQYGERGDIRYIVCGENGSKRGRVHWHAVLFSPLPLLGLGKWERMDGVGMARGEYEFDAVWSMWPHGSVYLQMPDAGGIAYALKYAQKDQFNVHKSANSSRQTTAEVHSAGMFRMSKKPPIGWRYLEQYCDRMEQLGAVPVSLNIPVPDYKGFWYPTGSAREYLRHRLHMINQARRRETGRDCPQWSTLLHGLEDDESKIADWEGLIYGEIDVEPLTADALEQVYACQQRAASAYTGAKQAATATREVVRSCGASTPCYKCQNALKQDGVEIVRRGGLDDQFLEPHDQCFFKDLPDVQGAFRRAKTIDRLQRTHNRA